MVHSLRKCYSNTVAGYHSMRNTAREFCYNTYNNIRNNVVRYHVVCISTQQL